MTRVVFLGTPVFAVPCLQALADSPGFAVVGVVTQPDRPAGRGQQMQPPAVKQRALALGLPVFQPETLRDEAAINHLQSWQPDVIVVAAFGQILRRPVLEMPPHGCINVHASLLPRWRGAAPIQHAIRAGDAETGITIMKMDEGLDTGPILARRAIPITQTDTAASLHDKLAALGAEMLPGVLASYLRGEIVPCPQPEEGVTLAPTLDKSAGRIDWSRTAVEIDRQVRACDPWPGTFTHLGGEVLRVLSGAPRPDEDRGVPPGTLLGYADGLAVQTGSGLYVLNMIQPAGKKRMTAQAFLRGHAAVVGMRLGDAA